MLLAGCADETITHMFDTDDDGELINPSMDVLFKIFETCLLPKKAVLGCPSVLTIDSYDCYFFRPHLRPRPACILPPLRLSTRAVHQ